MRGRHRLRTLSLYCILPQIDDWIKQFGVELAALLQHLCKRRIRGIGRIETPCLVRQHHTKIFANLPLHEVQLRHNTLDLEPVADVVHLFTDLLDDLLLGPLLFLCEHWLARLLRSVAQLPLCGDLYRLVEDDVQVLQHNRLETLDDVAARADRQAVRGKNPRRLRMLPPDHDRHKVHGAVHLLHRRIELLPQPSVDDLLIFFVRIEAQIVRRCDRGEV